MEVQTKVEEKNAPHTPSRSDVVIERLNGSLVNNTQEILLIYGGVIVGGFDNGRYHLKPG